MIQAWTTSTDYRMVQIGLFNKLPSVAGAGLIQLGCTLRQVIDTIYGKPFKSPSGLAGHLQFNYTDINTFPQYFGARQQPGGIQ
jgi:hypothetical protein